MVPGYQQSYYTSYKLSGFQHVFLMLVLFHINSREKDMIVIIDDVCLIMVHLFYTSISYTTIVYSIY